MRAVISKIQFTTIHIRETKMLNKLAFGLVICSVAAGASSQTITNIQAKTSDNAYLQDDRGVVARSPFGLCWRTGYWTPVDAVTGCDGELAAPIAKITAPAMATSSATTSTAIPVRCDVSITLTSDQIFAFNKVTLTNAAKKRIDDEVLGKLTTCARIEAISVTGHTDHLGSRQYNQKLSEKRAHAVTAYLKEKGISARIDTLGAGEVHSINFCEQKLTRPKLIECLAPNRRVAIEVRGTAK